MPWSGLPSKAHLNSYKATYPFSWKELTAATIFSAMGPLYKTSAPWSAMFCNVSAKAGFLIISPS